MELLPLGLESWKEMVTKDLDTIKLLEAGRLAFSSGRAEVKSQSSSTDAPLVCCGVLLLSLGDFDFSMDDAKSNIEGVVEDGFGGCVRGKGKGCRGAGADKMAKGSDGGCVALEGFEFCCDWSNDGAGVADCEEG